MSESETVMAYVAFKLGEEQFALPVAQVREILELDDITPVPEAPDYMRGILNLRGNVLSVMDSRRRLRLPAVEDTKKTRIIVLDVGDERMVGIVVDAVTDVLNIEAEQLIPTSEMGEMNQSDYIEGTARVGEGFVLILAPHKIVDNAWVASEADLPQS